jgi:hypothetical protein
MSDCDRLLLLPAKGSLRYRSLICLACLLLVDYPAPGRNNAVEVAAIGSIVQILLVCDQLEPLFLVLVRVGTTSGPEADVGPVCAPAL